MAYIIQDTTLSRIAEAIRAKNGTTDKIKVSDMAAMIEAIKAGGDDKSAAIIDRSITEYSNGSIETIGMYAFNSCSSLKTVDIPAVTSVESYAFCSCGLKTIDLPAAARIGNAAFSYCSNLETVKLPVATFIDSFAFQNCENLTSINIPEATAINQSCFESCSKLISIDLPKVIELRSQGFSRCNMLSTVNLPIATSIGNYVFSNCSNLTTVSLPAATSIGSDAFDLCSSLTTLDLPAAIKIGSYTFQNCRALKALIIRTEQVCSLQGKLGTDSCYIYVPRALVNDYKAATNWAQYADKFRALEDYTVDGTTTGELDTTKIQ